MSILDAALTWADGGFNVIPIRNDGTKKPVFDWKRFQADRINHQHLQLWFGGNSGAGLGIICGKVSGNLEMLELEGRATDVDSLRRIQDELRTRGAIDIWDEFHLNGYVEETPSGGIHILYRIADHEVPGNTRIAGRPATAEELAENPKAKVKVLAETRGEGGYLVAAPSGGRVHKTGRAWNVLAGSIGVVPTITWEQRCLVHDAIAAALDVPLPSTLSNHPGPPVPRQASTTHPASSNRPGDDFNIRADWEQDVIGPHGWRVHPDRGRNGETLWTRPGKEHRDGHSATTGYANDADRLYVFSSSTEFDTETPYTKFAAYTLLNHRGDFAAATRDLAAQGYGESLRSRLPATTWQQDAWATADIGGTEQDLNAPAAQHPGRRNFLPEPRSTSDYTFSGAASRFVAQHGQYVRYVHEAKIWRVWDGIIWAEDKGAAQVMRAFEAMTEQMLDEARGMDPEDGATKAFRKHVTKLRDSGRTTILAMIASKVSVSVDIFDADTRYFNVLNGIYDVVDCVFLPHDPKYMLTKVAGITFDPDAKAPGASKFFEELMPDFGMRDYTMRALGYSLTGEADQRAFFLLQGLPGTGKTQFIEMMQTIFGDYGVTAMASTFHKRPNTGSPTPDIHALRGARFITTSETSQDTQLDEELIKRFTGKDMMSTRALYEAPQQWVPTGAVWFATNHLPKFSSDEEAIWRRVKTIPFNTQFTDDGSSGHTGEPNLGRKLAAAEGSGIFNLLLEALAAYRAAGRLTEPAELKAAVADHKREVDPVAQFWDEAVANEAVVEAPGDTVEFKVIYRAYCLWHEENISRYPMGSRRFANSLRAIVGYEQLAKSNGKTYLPGWRKMGWIIGTSG